LEHNRTKGTLVLAREALCLQKQRAVTEMHAVEIAQGHHGALRVGGTVTIVTQDSHQAVSAGAFAGASLDGTFTSASPSTTTVSPTVHEQSKVTRPLGALISRTAQVATTVSPIRTGALKRKLAPMKMAPAPGSLVPSTVDTNVTGSMPCTMRPLKRVF